MWKISPLSGRKVWYVKAGSVAVKLEPNAGAQTVRALETGDNVLIQVQGDWGQTDYGWVPMNAVSETPKGRTKGQKNWQ